MSEPAPVRLLEEDSVDAATAMAARAFEHDPGVEFLFPSLERRRSVLPRIMRLFIRYGLLAGTVEVAGEEIDSLAVWLPPPGRKMASAGRMVQSGILRDIPELRAGESLRMLVLDTYVNLFDRSGFGPPHHYLWVLCTNPARHGQGLASSVMQPGFERAERDGLPACLETLTLENVRFYNKRGFRVMKAGKVPFGGPQVWSLRRDPRAEGVG